MAIAAVLLFHAFFDLTLTTPAAYIVRKTFAPLWVGVDIFFVLSGFLITGILMDTRASPHRMRSFYMRRVLRIAPLYFATLAVVFFVLPAMHLLPKTASSGQFWYWTYLYNWSAAWGFQAFGLVHVWSLAVEEQFYLVWPLLLFWTPLRRVPALFAILIASSFLFRLGVFVLHLPSRYDYFLTPARMEDLCYGALAAWLVRDPVWLARARPWLPRLAGAFATLALAAYILGKGFEGNKWPALIFGYTAVAALTAILIVDCVSHETSQWWHRALASPTLRWLGTYSYGIYVFHQSIINAVADRLNGTNLAWYSGGISLAIAASCLAGWLSYHTFERHFLRLKRAFAP